ncbi:MAG TPA: cytochrome b [Hyphomicrobiaceae bacterium]|nr:cytochrome b [Hyphomicrobiaceae bacterium]
MPISRKRKPKVAPAGVQPSAQRTTRHLTYSPTARVMHWLMAALIIFQFAAGLIMVYDGPKPNLLATVSDSLALYDTHKLLGVALVALVLVRISYRILRGAPADEPSMEVWQREASHFVHAWIYLLMIAVPLLGWIGVSLYPALVVYGAIPLPALLSPDRARSAVVLAAHAAAAYVLIAMIAMHVGAVFYHRVIRRDGVLRRMWPGLGTRKDET